MMQLKLKQKPNVGSTLVRMFIKSLLMLVLLMVVFFLLEKINFPTPSQNIKIDITNEVIKLK
tara:strand:- start:354 stop:539 length:186 start_codon:yes stop_codon:yes gene_type:complete